MGNVTVTIIEKPKDVRYISFSESRLMEADRLRAKGDIFFDRGDKYWSDGKKSHAEGCWKKAEKKYKQAREIEDFVLSRQKWLGILMAEAAPKQTKSDKDRELAAHWKTQIEQCDKANDRWHKRGDKIIRHYRDEREDLDVGVAKRFNLFWANTETLKPVIYSKMPLAIAERRFLDKDTTGRVAATILERALRYEMPTCGFDRAARRARNDYLGPGRGQVWIRYNPKFGIPISPQQSADNDIQIDGELQDETREKSIEQQTREFLSESLDVSYCHWKDFYIFPATARIWEEVEGVGRRLYMSRQDLIDNFDEDIGKKIELDYLPKTDVNQGGQSNLSGHEGMQATTYEIWWKPTRKVYFIAKSYDGICKEADDPLKLEKFFPCPEPISATTTNDTMIPVPDYVESQDQYIQIDDLTKRIDILTAACKVVGVYDASAEGLKRVFQEAQEPNLIPVNSWAAFAEKGGLKSSLDFLPIEQMANTVQALIEVRTQIIQDLDRTTGISDIMRGTSDPRETMGAQRLKSNNSATRVQERQDDFARFCRDIICIMGELIAEHFDPATLIQVSGAMYDEGLDPPDLPSPPVQPNPAAPPPAAGPSQPGPGMPSPPASMPPQAAPPGLPPAGPQLPMVDPAIIKQQRKEQFITDAIMLLRNDKMRGFRIDIETDSTVAGDAEQEKEQRIQFVQGVTQFIETAGQLTMQAPSFAPLAAKMLQFAVRGFRVGRDLESAIEEFCDQAESQAKQNASNPKPDPEQIKQQTEVIKQQGEVRSQQVEAQSEQTNAMIRAKEAADKDRAQQQQQTMELAKMQRQDEFDMRELHRKEAFAAAEHGRKMEELHLQAEMKKHERETRKKEMNGASHD